MGQYIQKHRHKFLGVAFPLFFLFVVGWIGVTVFPGWVSPTFGTLGAPCTQFATDSSDPLIGACDRCVGEVCSFASGPTGVCTQDFFGFAYPPCPSCQCDTFISTTGTFFFVSTMCGAPDDAFCQNIAGGDGPNDCRNATCTTNTAIDLDSPSGCDFTFDTGNVDCVNCAPPTDPSINCGNGVCEEAEGEDFDNCFADCMAPGFPFDTPLPESSDPFNPLNEACAGVLTITFSGNIVGSGTCEDGDVCTTNVCTGAAAPICDVEPADCNASAPDFCCPDGCNPPPDGPGTCNANLDPNCDDDCLPSQDCEPTPSPTASPIPPPGTPLRVFGSKPFCSLGDRGPSQGWQGALALASLAVGLGVLSLWRKRTHS